MVTCNICKKDFKNGGVLARHLVYNHGITYREYYHREILKTDAIPVCKCGCGKEMRWTTMGYTEFAKGHYSRIHNNWGHNQKAIDNSVETRRQQFASGKRKVWNDGLTKEDSRVKDNIDRCKKSINSNPDELKRRSYLMKKNRLSGIIPTLRGPQHSQWKGGVSEINALARSRTRLYKEWKFPILVRDGFKCVECGKTSPLHVHHDKEQMCEIIARHIVDGIEPRTFEEKEFIADAVVDYHIKNNVSGTTLCDECHNKIHPSLNFS